MNTSQLRWEYRPWWFFYIPIYIYWLLLSVKARSLTFFSAANPGIFFGGFVSYSKRSILSQFEKDLIPETLYLQAQMTKEECITQRNQSGLSFPLVVKPDQGRRGQGVKKVISEEALHDALDEWSEDGVISQDILIQAFADGKEFAVLYYRYPGQKRGVVAGLTQKEYFTVIGDGQKKVSDLVQDHERGDVYYDFFAREDLPYRETIPASGEEVVVMPIGSHWRGTLFMDISDRIDETLHKTFDAIADQVSGFSFGRFDIKAESFEALRQGKCKILELNGAEAEPVHMYDPQNSVWEAYRTMFDHRKTLFNVSLAHHRNGVRFLSYRKAFAAIKKEIIS